MYLKFYQRLNFKIHIILFLIISLSVFLTTYIFLNKQEDYFLSNLKENGKKLSVKLAKDSRYGVLTGNRKSLESYVSGILASRNVYLIFIEDIKRKNLLVKIKDEGNNAALYKNIIRESQAKQGIQDKENGENKESFSSIKIGNKKFVSFITPVKVEKEAASRSFIDGLPHKQSLILGYVHVVFSMQEIDNMLMQSKKDAFLISLFLFLIFYLLAIIFSKRIVRPVHDLIDATREVAEGNLDVTIKNTPKNEIGLLTDSFFEMAKSIKEKRELEEKVFSMEKIVSLGRLSGGVAHEFNNILTSIKTEAEASLDINHSEYYRSSMENILESAYVASTVTANLLNFAKPVKPKKEKINIKDVVEKSIDLVKQELNNFGIKTSINDSNEIYFCFIDPRQIQLVFINILTNARDSMRNGGSLKVDIRKEENFVVISFEDSGHGMSNEVKKKVFEPFYTTKSDYGKSKIPGTGLGLNVSSELIKIHSGKITIESEEGSGCIVSVWMPIEEE